MKQRGNPANVAASFAWRALLAAAAMGFIGGAGGSARAAGAWGGCYHNNPLVAATEEALPVKLAPGVTNHFLEVDEARTNVTFYYLAAPASAAVPGAESGGVRLWANKEYVLAGNWVTSFVLSAGGPTFHETPAAGAVTVDLWRAEWQPPPGFAGRVFYAPRIIMPAEAGMPPTTQYLIRTANTGAGWQGGPNTNYWRQRAQTIGPDFFNVDYSFDWTRCIPAHFEDLERAIAMLNANPPGFASNALREQAFLELDTFFETGIRRGQAFDLAASSNRMWELLDGRLRKALAETTAAPSDSALRAWQMYNMGLLAVSGGGVAGFDIIPVLPGCGWQESADFVRDLAAGIHVLFITHGHVDHYSRSLVQACLDAGRPVCLPAESAGAWAGHSNLVAVGDHWTGRLAGLQVTARRGIHGWHATRADEPLIYYELTFPTGRTLIFCGDLDYTREFEKTPGLAVDLLVIPWRSPSLLYETGAREQLHPREDAVRIALERIQPRFLLYGHYAELGHVYDGMPASYAIAAQLKRILPCPSEWMFWGEHLTIPAP